MIKKATIVILGGIVLAAATFGVILFLQAHQVENATAWANALRQIDGAKHEWALEKDKHTNDTPTWSDISLYLDSRIFTNFSYTNGTLVSPKGAVYTIGRVDEAPKCYKDGKTYTLP